MRILLVEPYNPISLTGAGATPPLWPCVLSAQTPQPHHVDFVHCAFQSVTPDLLGTYDLVGISCRTDTARHGYQIADMSRAQSIPTVLGGVHPYFMPDEAAEHADSVVLGECERLWPGIVEDARMGRLEDFYQGEHTPPENMPLPDLSIVKKYPFSAHNVLETVRGCPSNCSFCSATLYNGRKYRYKSLAQIEREIKSWTRNGPLVVFADLDVAIHPGRAKEIFKLLAPYHLHWMGYASVNVTEDDELLQLMMESGCSYLGIGFESVSTDALEEMDKKKNTKIDYKTVVKRLHAHNIDVFGNFIFGLDSDTEDTFDATVDFVLDSGIDFPVYNTLVPYPGTRVFDALEKEGRIYTRDWSRYTRCEVVFQPKNMDRERLIQGLFHAYEQSYSNSIRIRRFFERWRGIRRTIQNKVVMSHLHNQFKVLKKYRKAA